MNYTIFLLFHAHWSHIKNHGNHLTPQHPFRFDFKKYLGTIFISIDGLGSNKDKDEPVLSEAIQCDE